MKAIASKLRFSTKFMSKLVLGMIVVSIIGFVGIFLLSNTIVRSTFYESSLEGERLRHTINAIGFDALLTSAKQRVVGLATVMRELPDERAFENMAARFVNEYPIIEDVFIIFRDGRYITGTGLPPCGHLIAVSPDWFLTAAGEPGAAIATEPYLNLREDKLSIAVITYLPELRGAGAVIATSFAVANVLDLVDQFIADDSTIILINNETGNVIRHHNEAFGPAADGTMINVLDIPGGGFFSGHLGTPAISRGHCGFLGQVYIISTPLDEADWTLFTVIPTTPIESTVSRFVAIVVIAFAALMLALFAFILGVARYFYGNIDYLQTAKDKLSAILDNMPLVTHIHTKDFKMLECNNTAPVLFGFKDKHDYLERFFEVIPEFQPDGRKSRELMGSLVEEVLEKGRTSFEWMHTALNGEEIPAEVTLTRITWHDEEQILASIRDLRDYYKASAAEGETHRRVKMMLDTCPMVCSILDAGGNVLEVNKEVERLLDIPNSRMYIENFYNFCPEYQPDGLLSAEKIDMVLEETFTMGRNMHKWTYLKPDGELVPTEQICERVEISGKQCVVIFTRDLRDLYKYQKVEHTARMRIQAMLDSSPLACFTLDEDFNVLEINKASVALYKVRDDREFKERFFDLVPEYQPDGSLSVQKMKDLMMQCFEKGSVHYEWVSLTITGEEIPSEMNATAILIDGKKSVIVHQRDLRDILQVVEMATYLELLAYTDALTDINNRRHFMEVAQRMLNESVQKNLDFSLIIFDLDDFKLVNDTYGHHVGDMVLKITAARAKNALKSGTLIARFGGEEFIVAMQDNIERTEKAAIRIKDRLSSAPFVVDEHSLKVTASFGVANRLPGKNLSLEEIINNADKALYDAKHSGKNQVISNR